jgi:nitrogen-specific signal transduction histidine kinase
VPEVAEPFHFRPSARLQRFLGRELIADPNVAIIEFVKNSYDAGASRVVLDFALADSPSTLSIADDGVGMNARLFEANWMHPGYSEKGTRTTPRLASAGANAAEAREAGRVPVGEKGIGRLAAGRLGEKLDVFSRRARNQPWLHVQFDWADFDNMDLAIDEVAIHYDYDTPPENPPFPVGTILVISELSQNWAERVRGRAVRGRRRTKLGRLKQDLEFLVRPLAAQDDEFAITLTSDMIREADDIGEITPRSAVEEADYSCSFAYGTRHGKPQIERTIFRSAEAADLTGKPRVEHLKPVPINTNTARLEERPADLLCGPFEGRFLYNPPPAAKRAREIDESLVGVLLYRDGLLVEPYGIGEDDWLGVRARKAQRQGHAAIQPDTFFGHVLITRRRNRELRDQSNRLGLLETAASENFLDHVRAEFSVFEDLLYGEVLEARWEPKAEKATKRAQESQERSLIFLRSLAHSLRQPLQGLGWELVGLDVVSERADVPADARESLKGISARAMEHVALAEALITPLLSRETPEFGESPVGDIIDEAVAQNRLLIQNRDATVTVDHVATKVLVPTPLVGQALAALVANALEAARSNGDPVEVVISARKRNRDVAITVADNGRGIDGAATGVALSSIASTKGRPAAGLQSAETAITAARGRLRLIQSGTDGTTFEVLLPTRVAGLSE